MRLDVNRVITLGNGEKYLIIDKVVIDAGKSFTYGQVYVALSRCRSLDGIVLTSVITPKVVMIDPIVIEYTQLVEHIWPEEHQEARDNQHQRQDRVQRQGAPYHRRHA